MATLGCHIAQWWLRYADVTDLPYRPPEHKDVILHQKLHLVGIYMTSKTV